MKQQQFEEEMLVGVNCTCPICGCVTTVLVLRKDWDVFKSPNRPYVQDIFPYLSAEEREVLISGVCSTCWEEMYGGNE